MKLVAVMIVVLGGCVLAGCRTPTLEEARAACTKQGGLLVVLYTQKITLAGPGEQTASPGDCISPRKFDAPHNAPAPAR